MPVWAQNLTRFNPIAYFVEVMRMVLLKGSGFMDIRSHFFIILSLGLGVNLIWNGSRRSISLPGSRREHFQIVCGNSSRQPSVSRHYHVNGHHHLEMMADLYRFNAIPSIEPFSLDTPI